MMMEIDLFRFAYVPHWHDQLDRLAAMTLPEPWRFRGSNESRKNTKTPVAERYIHAVFRTQAIDYNNATSQNQADDAFMVRGEYAVFNTGLFTRYMKPVYGYFEKNKREGVLQEWCFRGFMDDSTPPLKYINPLPQRPFQSIQQEVAPFLAILPIRVNVEHIVGDPENLMRLPEWCRTFGNLSLLLETAVETTRRMAQIMPGIVVPQVYQGRVQYLMPICLSHPNHPDLAMTVTPMDGFYLCSTCLTLEMAYSNARLLATPTVSWLTSLVE